MLLANIHESVNINILALIEVIKDYLETQQDIIKNIIVVLSIQYKLTVLEKDSIA